MPASPPEIRIDNDPDGEVIVEAPTAEVALTEVANLLGDDARILSAEKVLRGGIGGFFAREVVQVRAVAQEAGGLAEVATAPEPEPEIVIPAHRSAVDSLLTSLTAEAAKEERSFQEVLRSQLAAVDAPSPILARDPEPGPLPPVSAAPAGPQSHLGALTRPPSKPLDETVAPPAPLVAVAPVVPVLPAPPASVPQGRPGAHSVPAEKPAAGPGWSVGNLQRLGLPGLVVDAVREMDGADDMGWVAAIAGAVGTLCRPLPAGDCVLVGPRAQRLAEPLGLRQYAVGDATPELGSFAVTMKDSRRSRAFLAAARGHRWPHLVIGGGGWRDLLFDEPLAVSWVGDEDLPAALSLAADLGLVLGYGMGVKRGACARRANPVDVALAIRELVRSVS